MFLKLTQMHPSIREFTKTLVQFRFPALGGNRRSMKSWISPLSMPPPVLITAPSNANHGPRLLEG